MQFMIIRKADAATEAGLPPAPGLFEAMEAFNARLAGEGRLGLALGLRPSRHAVRLKLGPGGAAITDGPFAQARELVAGFTIIEAASREAALELLRQWPASDAAATGEAVLELRETGCPGGCAEVASPLALEGGGGDGDDRDTAARYVILLRTDEDSERDAIPARHKLDALDAFNLAQAEAGVLLAGAGLKSSARGARVTLKGGRVGAIDGPFAEAKELIAGFWMIRAASMRAAIDWARGLPYPTGPEVEVEIREVMTLADLGLAPEAGPRADASPGASVDA